MKIQPAFAGLAASVLTGLAPCVPHAETVPMAQAIGTLTVSEALRENEDVSGIVLRDPFMLLAVDEGRTIEVLEARRPDEYEVVESKELLGWPDDGELDLEGLAATERYVYAIGSHSRKRRAVDSGKKVKKNRKRLLQTAIEPSREYLFRFEVERDGKVKKKKIRHVTLRNLFAGHPLLRPFQAIPSKENGIDVEGIAAAGDDRVYLGLRGPVLRGGYVPILILQVEEDGGKLEVKHDVERDVRFVNLGGRGVRDMASIAAPGGAPGFLLLAGPVGDGPASYQVYEWDGRDAVPGRDAPDAHQHARLQCEIPRPDGVPRAKAEGIAPLAVSGDTLEFVVVYDSAPRGAPTRFRCPRRAPG